MTDSHLAEKNYRNNLLQTALCYVVTILLVFVVLWLVFDLQNADLSVPVTTVGDAYAAQMYFKGVQDLGFSGAYVNPYLAAPTGGNYLDYPAIDLGTFGWVTLISLFTTNYAVTFNLFILSTYFIAAIIGLFVLRKFGIENWLSVCLAVLFAFIPFHLLRLPHVLFLTYGFAALAILLCFYLLEEPKRLFYSDNSRNSVRAILTSVVLCFLLPATGGVYCVAFSLIIIFGALVYILLSMPNDRKQTLINGLGLMISLVVGLVVNLLPNIIHFIGSGGINSTAMPRNVGDAETYGLKISQLLLPRPGHRVSLLNELQEYYRANYPLVNENETSSLGIIGAVGFLVLIVILFVNRGEVRFFSQARWRILKYLAAINLIIVLTATIGGFETIISFVFYPIRGYNRISVYIAFISLVAVGYLLSTVFEKIVERFSITLLSQKIVRVFAYALALLLLLEIGILDQTTQMPLTSEKVSQEYYSEQSEIQSITEMFNPGDMIYQLPYSPYPFAPYIYFFPYLQDQNQLRWSSGSIAGRTNDRILQNLEELDIEERVVEAKELGFRGILVQQDLFSYSNTRQSLLDDLESTLGAPIYESYKYVVFDLKTA